MRSIFLAVLLAASIGLSGCAGVMREPPVAGDTVQAVIGKFGQPSARHHGPGGEVFEYSSGPLSQHTWMARFGPDGRLTSFEQVLSSDGFARIKIDSATRAEVLRLLGQPAERSRVAMNNYEVWSYRYKESGVWDSMMHVHFDQAGVVRMLMNGPDPVYDKAFWRD